MKLRLSADVLARHPGLTVCGASLRGVAAAARRLEPAPIASVWRSAADAAEAASLTLQNLPSAPPVAVWRDASAASGLKASTWRSSVESILRRLLKEGPVRTPLPLVDLYCALSARHCVPIGIYDVDRLPVHEIDVRFGRPNSDRFEPLGGRASDMKVTGEIVVYAAGDEIICWHFNHRDSARTSLIEETERAVVFSEALTPEGAAASRRAVSELIAILAGRGAVASEVQTASAQTATVEIEAAEPATRQAGTAG